MACIHRHTSSVKLWCEPPQAARHQNLLTIRYWLGYVAERPDSICVASGFQLTLAEGARSWMICACTAVWTCGWMLAPGARPVRGPVAIAACLGGSDAFGTSITDFSQRYADRNERDDQAFVTAIRSGRRQALKGV